MLRTTLWTVSLLAVFCAAIAAIRPSWATSLGMDLWNLPQLERDLADREQWGAELARRTQIIKDRTFAKTRLTQELIEGQWTLRETAARFRILEMYPEPIADFGAPRFPGHSEGERYCNAVLQWVRADLHDEDAAFAKKVTDRLERELAEYMASHNGDVVLPEVK